MKHIKKLNENWFKKKPWVNPETKKMMDDVHDRAQNPENNDEDFEKILNFIESLPGREGKITWARKASDTPNMQPQALSSMDSALIKITKENGDEISIWDEIRYIGRGFDPEVRLFHIFIYKSGNKGGGMERRPDITKQMYVHDENLWKRFENAANKPSFEEKKAQDTKDKFWGHFE